MTHDNTPEDRRPSLRDRMKPAEFLGIAVVLALFAGLIVLMSTREPILALIFFGVAFIATLVVLVVGVLLCFYGIRSVNLALLAAGFALGYLIAEAFGADAWTQLWVGLGAAALVWMIVSLVFRFATFVEGFRGWGRSLRRAVGAWYAARSPDVLAYQAVKYRQREGVTHRDVLRLAHPAKQVSAGTRSST